MNTFLLQFFIFLVAAVIAVPVAKKLKLGSVLGYLLAGIAIGPFGIALIKDIESVLHFTEFGVVLMLFLIGLELRPSMLWKMRTPILGIGGSQVLLTTLFIGGGMLFLGPWQQALAVGMTLALSSTAIVLQTLREKGWMNSPPGQSAFSVLLFQDVAVIPILALLPMLATSHGGDAGNGGHGNVLFDITSLPTHFRILAVLGAIAAIIALGRYISRPLFRIIASTRVREVFVAAALALVIGIAILMTLVGLSPALGAFIAGVVLADSEYRHELESDIEPFKGLLLGIFFISIGASLDFLLIGENLSYVAALVGALIAIKLVALVLVALVFRMPKKEIPLFALALAQGGEFAFVLFQFARTHGILPAEVTTILVSVAAISMFIAPFLFILYDKAIAPRLARGGGKVRAADTVEHKERKVILAGFGRLGTDLGRLLISSGFQPVILDHDESNVAILRKFGFEVYYGDATRLDLLESAGAAEAELIVIALDGNTNSLTTARLVKKHFPSLKIAVSAKDRRAAFELMALGVDSIRRETFSSALHLGQDALGLLGMHPYEAYRRMGLFRKYDEGRLHELYHAFQGKEDDYVSLYREHEDRLLALMTRDMELNTRDEVDRAWTAVIKGEEL